MEVRRLCFNYSKFSINVLAGCFSLIIVLLIFIISNRNFVRIDIVQDENSLSFHNFEDNPLIDENINIENNENDVENKNSWKLEIPRIELCAEISEGTGKEVLDVYIGHFKETSLFDGNVGLAAHNRGYNVNYFAKIKELETGDEIYYSYNGNTRKYIVKTRDIIKETDWSYLEKTDDNRITLITCVEDMPEYRRCIQAVEEKEE